MPPPERNAVACGALGRYRPELVAGIARRMEVPMQVRHRDRRSILMLDRPAIQWGAGRRRGLAWSELPDANELDPPSSWQDAATRLRACGLGIEPGSRFVHSSVAGIAPIYHLEHDGASYFASRIDPLVGALERTLTVDWSAWASILCLGHPVGEQTPFAEVRVLPPFQRLDRARSRARLSAPAEWPWQRPEPILSVAEGTGPMLAALRARIERLATVPAVSLLSGGLDSRLLLALLVEAGADVEALTLGPDEARPIEQRFAADVARGYGIRHEVIDYGDPGEYLAAWAASSLAVDFQRVRSPGLSALAEPLSERRRLAVDGLALDTLATHSSPAEPRFYTPEMLTTPDASDRTALTLWRRTARKGMGHAPKRVLSSRLAAKLARLSRRAFVAESLPLRSHPSQALLLLYRTRTVRGISPVPHQILGARAAVATPFADHEVVLACAAMDPHDKHGFRLYEALFDAVDPEVRQLPSTVDPTPGRSRAQRQMRRSDEALARFENLLRNSPLAGYHSDELRGHLEAGTLGRGLTHARGFYSGVLALSLFSEWVERYGWRLRGLDPPLRESDPPDGGPDG
jgi:hypothetical protein